MCSCDVCPADFALHINDINVDVSYRYSVKLAEMRHWLYFLLSERKLPVAKRPVSLSGAMVTGVPRSLSGDENETPPDYPSPPTPASAAQPTSGDPESSSNTEGGAGTHTHTHPHTHTHTLRVEQLFFFFVSFCSLSVRHRVTSCVSELFNFLFVCAVLQIKEENVDGSELPPERTETETNGGSGEFFSSQDQ